MATDTEGGICSFSHRLRSVFFSEMRTRPAINLHVIELLAEWNSRVIDGTFELAITFDVHRARVQLNGARTHLTSKVQLI